MGFNDILENKESGRPIAVGFDLFAIDSQEIGRLERTRSHIDNKLHQTFCTNVTFARCTEDGNYIAFGQAQFQTGTQFVRGEDAFLKIELHKSLVIFSGSLSQDAVQFRGPFHLFGRNLHLFTDAGIAFEFVHLHQQNVDESIEIRTRIHRILNNHRSNLRGGAE